MAPGIARFGAWPMAWPSRPKEKRPRRRSVQLLDPDIANRHFRRRLDLDAELARLIVRRLWIVVDHHRHQLAVDDVEEGAAARDDDVLIPVVHLHDAAEAVAVGDRAHEALA